MCSRQLLQPCLLVMVQALVASIALGEGPTSRAGAGRKTTPAAREKALRGYFGLVDRLEYAELSTWLERHGLEVDAVDASGQTALMRVVEKCAAVPSAQEWTWKQCQHTLERLVELGARMTAKNAKGLTVLQLATLTGSAGVVRVLLRKKADASVRDVEGNTLLHLATVAAVPQYEHLPALIVSTVATEAGVPLTDALNDAQQNAIVYMCSLRPPLPERVFRERLEALLQRRVSFEHRDVNGKSARDHLEGLPELLSVYDHYIARSREGVIDKPLAELPSKVKPTGPNPFDKQVAEYQSRLEAWKNRQRSERETRKACERCSACFGFGTAEPQVVVSPCERCMGSGVSRIHSRTIDGYSNRYTYYTPEPCPVCFGSGQSRQYVETRCPVCGGTGCEPHSGR